MLAAGGGGVSCIGLRQLRLDVSDSLNFLRAKHHAAKKHAPKENQRSLRRPGSWLAILTRGKSGEAVARVSNLLYRGFPTRGTPVRMRPPADWKSATQQVGNLRYEAKPLRERFSALSNRVRFPSQAHRWFGLHRRYFTFCH